MFFLFAVIICLYACLIIYSIHGWNNPQVSPIPSKKHSFFSIIIAIRNEQSNIEHLLNCLTKQNYPDDKYEILIADDHSTDMSWQIITTYSQQHKNILIFSMPDEIHGKKASLKHTLPYAQGEYLLFTDADCSVLPEWISTYNDYCNTHQASLYFGSVSHTPEQNIAQKCFSLDFLGIIATQAGMALKNHAFSCNAANMCISKSFYSQAYNTNTEFSSGDDVFLLHAAKKINNSVVHFIKNPQNTVITHPPHNYKEFISQRLRWASKASGYTDTDALIVSAIVYATSCMIFSTGIFALIHEKFITLFLLVFTAKTIVDIILFSTILPYFKKQKLVWYVIPFQFLYVIYITIIPIFAILFPQTWKNRKIK